MRFVRELARLHLGNKLLHRLDRDPMEIGVLLHEARNLAVGEAHQVVENQDLPGTVGAGSDPDGGDVNCLGDFPGQLAGDGFQDHAEGPGGLHCLGVGQEPAAGLVAPP